MENIMTKEDKEKSILINKILQVCKACGIYIGGELCFSLAFKTVPELKSIANTLHIK